MDADLTLMFGGGERLISGSKMPGLPDEEPPGNFGDGW
jgi:hypothetical protein